MRGRFVGRANEVGELEAIMAASRARRGPTAAIVVGAPGSGKSRLLREVADRPRSAVLLRVVGYEPEQGVPLSAARDLLVELGRSGTAGGDVEALASGTAEWGPSAIPLRLFETTYRRLASRAPALVIVDDLQWVDDVSAALLSYLIRASATEHVPVALLAAARPSPAVGALRDALVTALAPDAPVEIDLAPLPEDEGIAMVTALAPSVVPDEASRIWRAAAGSPFWIEALTIEGATLMDGLARRFGQLGQDGADVLQALAIVGRPTDRLEVATALGWPPERVDAAADELRHRGLAIEVAGMLETAHDLIREAALHQVPVSVARHLHARLSRDLRARAGSDVRLLREALDHATAADEPGLGIALELAGAPRRRLIGPAGIRDLGRVAAAADPSDSERQLLEQRLAELAGELGDRALELERWLVVAEHPAPMTRARALVSAAKAAYRMGRRNDAADLLARARALRVDDLAIEITIDALESEVLRWLDHRLPEARRHTRRAVERAQDAIAQAERAGVTLDPHLRVAAVEALQAAHDLALQEGDDQEQLAFAERLVGISVGELERMEAELLLAVAYRRAGRTDAAEALARRVREQATQRVYPALMMTAGQSLARSLYRLGRMAEAAEVAEEVQQLRTRIGASGRFLAETRTLRPAIAVGRGDWRTGITKLRAEIEEEPDPHYQLGIHQEIALWLARLVGPDESDEILDQLGHARRTASDVGCPRCGMELMLRSAEILARLGQTDEARALLRSQLATRHRHGLEKRLLLDRAIATLRLADGDARRAAASLERLSRRLTASGEAREALWADLDRGAALLAAGDAAAAIAVYRSVAERAAAGGVLTDLQVAQQRLREVGARMSPPRPAAGPLGLSRRELEVARLAASGASNPEIATTLFLSRKTVERHVSAALAKAGARNRTELAARLAAHDLAPAEMRELPDTPT